MNTIAKQRAKFTVRNLLCMRQVAKNRQNLKHQIFTWRTASPSSPSPTTLREATVAKANVGIALMKIKKRQLIYRISFGV